MKNAFKKAQIYLKNKQRILSDFGENSPINTRLLPNMPGESAVIISQYVKETLELIQGVTTDEKVEIPFFLFGTVDGQIVYFDRIEADTDSLSAVEANYAKLVPVMQHFIINSPKNGKDILAHGHTHPVTIEYNKSFSLGDLNAYKNFRFDNDIFNSGKIKLCSCLLVDGQYNFLFFDGNDYYKFNNVYVQKENGDFESLPCYNNNMYTNNLGYNR